MAIFSAAVIGFIYFGGSGDYGGFEPPFSHASRASILSEHTTLSFPQCKEALRQRLLPSRASPLSAGYDLSRYLSLKIPARGKALVATDISISIPEGTDFFVFGFLGLPLKHWIDVGAGVIDDDLKSSFAYFY
ncbi:hypothetical protein Ahy_B05g078309 isoform A [Arachis hypogaea]|uniref:dUTP diphosphatase n=1 Tax=Arachis hypogaea TaxID=3818 RepID=A0A444Z6T6_ARAHY|nr:hypothetical protein Ahy_B05g078309 isoform A [Arachis hypogaea]